MSKHEDLRLIEHYLPIEAISAEASREKSVSAAAHGSITTTWFEE